MFKNFLRKILSIQLKDELIPLNKDVRQQRKRKSYWDLDQSNGNYDGQPGLRGGADYPHFFSAKFTCPDKRTIAILYFEIQ